MPQEPLFRPFNPDGELHIYCRNLPHWRQSGATYFVTFRQDDSIPAKVLKEWLDFFACLPRNAATRTPDSESQATCRVA